jgi:CheY-like chemotaxis protein
MTRDVDVLIIDDEQFDVELVLRALYLHSPDVRAAVAGTAAAAMEYLRSHSTAIILLDLHLPDMDGCDLLRWIRQHSHCSRVPVIVLTGDSGDRQRKDAHRLGVSAYINKTPDPKVLAEHLILFKHLLNKPDAPAI